MALLVEVVRTSLLIINEIRNICQEVDENQNACRLLSQRCDALQPSLNSLQRSKIPQTYESFLNQLFELLEEIKSYIKKFKKPIGNRFDYCSWYAKLALTRRKDISELERFSSLMNQLIQDLHFSVTVQMFDQNDCQSIRTDLLKFHSNLKQAAEGVDQAQIVDADVLDESLTILKEWDTTNKEIVELKQQIESSTSNPTPVSMEELRHMFEDFMQKNHFAPQNDYLKQIALNIPEQLRIANPALENQINIFQEQLKHQDEGIQDMLRLMRKIHRSQSEENILAPQLSKLKIQLHKVNITEIFLGRGTFGKVVVGSFDSHTVAIKIIDLPQESMKKVMENEVLLMSLCHHPSVLDVHGYCFPNPYQAYIVMELVPFGSLWTNLSKDSLRNVPFPLALSLAWINDICSAIQHLHTLRVIHRDIKAENILLTQQLFCKLTDFGIAKEQAQTTFHGVVTTSGTHYFKAPEAHDGKPTHRSDVYSMAITAYQILSRKSPNENILDDIEYLSFLNIRRIDEFVIPLQEYFNKSLQRNARMRINSAEAKIMIENLLQSLQGDPRIVSSHPDRSDYETICSELLRTSPDLTTINNLQQTMPVNSTQSSTSSSPTKQSMSVSSTRPSVSTSSTKQSMSVSSTRPSASTEQSMSVNSTRPTFSSAGAQQASLNISPMRSFLDDICSDIRGNFIYLSFFLTILRYA